MRKAVAEVQRQAALPRATKSTGPEETRKARQRMRFFRVFVDAMLKFHIRKKVKRKKTGTISPITKMPREPNGNLEGPCSLGCIVIRSCQRFNNMRCFLIIFSILIASQGTVFGLLDVSIDTFWRDNRLEIIESIMLALSYDISSFLVVVFISYYGEREKIVRWITASSFLVGFGSLLFAFPYFSGGNYQLNVNSEDICIRMKTITGCKKAISSQAKHVTFLILGQVMQGIAGMILYILGICFIEENVATHSAGIYLGLTEASVTIGYGLGYAIGAPLIKTSENITYGISIGNSGNNQNWMQTWWIRFLFMSIIAWSTSIPLSCFPSHIQGTTRIKVGKRKMPHLLDRKYQDKEFGTSIKDLFASIWILIKTPMFVCLALTKASESILTIGATEFLPIYIENQFTLTPSEATILAGIVLIPGAAIGQLLGGIIVSKLHMYIKGLMIFILATSAVSLVLVLFVFIVHCNPVPFAGISEDYSGTGQLGNMTAPCNADCACSSSFYSAICGRDDIAYFSPCFAGCTHSKTFNDYKTYFNCSCINEGLTTSDDEGDFIDARPGRCDAKCYKLPLFIVLTFSTVVFAGFSSIPNILTILRIVSDKQRPLALSVTYVILRIFGSIPGPIAFKLAGDSSCTFRDSGYCGKKGRCWIYDTTKMSYLFVGICFFSKVFTIFFTAIAFGLYKYLLRKNSEILPKPVKNIKVKTKRKN